MNGYIAITSTEWCENLKKNNKKEAIFWRKRLQFKAIERGDYYFLLSKPVGAQVRSIVGYAVYQESQVVASSNAWKKYGSKLGSDSEKEFLDGIRSIYKDDDVDLGCIFLKDVCFLKKPVSLEFCGIQFSPYIVSGKRLTSEECQLVLEKIRR